MLLKWEAKSTAVLQSISLDVDLDCSILGIINCLPDYLEFAGFHLITMSLKVSGHNNIDTP
jgi:hypothetical protein